MEKMRILLCNEAYLGDLILSTAVLKPIKEAYPKAHIGFLVGSCGKPVVEDHLLVDKIHVYDQESFNREEVQKRLKKAKEQRTKPLVFNEIKNEKYDVAIDLHSYYKENSAHLLYRLEIPKRIAYWTCKKPFFYNEIYTHWDCRYFHMLENHKVMLASFGIEEKFLSDFRPYLKYKTEEKNETALPENALLMHLGTGEKAREWEIENWIALAKKLEALGFTLVFIGKGEREKRQIEEVTKSLKNPLNYCNRLSWKQLIDVIKRAKFLIGLESMAGHLAAYAGIPALLIYSGPLPINWRPYHPYCQIIQPEERYFRDQAQLLPKYPISTISVESVFEKACRVLKAHKILPLQN